MFSQYNIWLSVFVAMLRFLLLVSEYIGLPLFYEYLKLRVLLVNEPFSLAWSHEPPALKLRALMRR